MNNASIYKQYLYLYIACFYNKWKTLGIRRALFVRIQVRLPFQKVAFIIENHWIMKITSHLT